MTAQPKTVQNANDGDFKVADISLAEWGREPAYARANRHGR